MPKKIFSFRLDEDLIAEVDRLHPARGERSEFVSAAISEKLHGAVEIEVGCAGPVTVADVMEPDEPRGDVPLEGSDEVSIRLVLSGVSPRLRPDAMALLAALRKNPMTPRDAEKAMGWLGLRYANAEKALISEGLVVLHDGVLIAEGSA